MTINFIQYLLIVEIASSIYLYKYFLLGNRKAWKAFVPVLKTIELMEMTSRPKWHTVLYFIPIVNHIMWVVSAYEVLHAFGRRKISDIILSVVSLGVYFGLIPYLNSLNYVGVDKKEITKQIGDLVPAIFFAIVAATVIRTFTFEAYVIPTSSMEKSLMVGDFLFVSKMHYGTRIPITPMSLPLLHASLPFTSAPSFSRAIVFPYFRLPRLQSIQLGDPVVFNYPMETDLPIDKRSNYVKRCVGLPGNQLEVISGNVHIDGKIMAFPDWANPQTSYYVRTNGVDFNKKKIKADFDINYLNDDQRRSSGGDPGDVTQFTKDEYIISINIDVLDAFKKLPNVVEVIRLDSPKDLANLPKNTPLLLQRYYQEMVNRANEFFMNGFHDENPLFPFSRDNYGPIHIPAAGETVVLNDSTYHLYKRIIEVYENHELEVVNGAYVVDGKTTDEYTFGQNYYWMMGDNRHNSSDSRYWGFVPEDHIVGKPVFIWMSLDRYASGINKIRTNRVFTTVNGSGKRFNYFWPIAILIAAYSFFNKRRLRAKKATK